MTEPRKDVKVYLDAEVHAALTAICEQKGRRLGEYIESLVVPHVNQIVDDVTVLHVEFLKAGISRFTKEPGGSGLK